MPFYLKMKFQQDWLNQTTFKHCAKQKYSLHPTIKILLQAFP